MACILLRLRSEPGQFIAYAQFSGQGRNIQPSQQANCDRPFFIPENERAIERLGDFRIEKAGNKLSFCLCSIGIQKSSVHVLQEYLEDKTYLDNYTRKKIAGIVQHNRTLVIFPDHLKS